MTDPDLLSLRDEIAVVDTLTSATLEGLDLGAALRSAASLRLHLQEFAAARSLPASRRDEATRRMNAMIDAMVPLVESAHAAQAAVDHALELMERRRRLVDSERRRLEALQTTLTASEAYLLVDAVVQSVTEHVHDPHALAAISHDLRRLLDAPAQ